jgi:arsenate reductase
MAEGWARRLKGEVIDAYSAGTHPKGLDPLAVQVMADVGIDLLTHQTKSLDAVQRLPFDYVITVCSDAHETCPVFPGRARIVHRGFDDPPRLAAAARTLQGPWPLQARAGRDQSLHRAASETLPTERETPNEYHPRAKPPAGCPPALCWNRQETMAETAEATVTGCCAPNCCGNESLDVTTLATRIGYTAEELSDLPAGANMGLSCGNPTAIASLQPGEVVVDLGSGGGFDLFLAGPKVPRQGAPLASI